MGRRLIIALSLFIGTLTVLVFYLPGLRPEPAKTINGVAQVGGPFTLVDTKDEPVTEAVLLGHYSLVYFGYTFCPDICPLALQNITQALAMAGPVADDVLPVFITIDPDRDTKEVLASYVTHFHPRMLALTGTPEQIRQAERAYRVYAAKAPPPAGQPAENYMMDHTGYIYLMDREGRYVAHFGKEATPKEISARMRRELNPRE